MAAETVKRGRGRPSAFKPEMCEQAYKLCLLGATDDQIADFFGLSSSIIDRWKKSNAEFAAALHAGKTEADAVIAESLFHKAKGYSHPEEKLFQHEGKIIRAETTKHYPPDTTACIFWLKNRQRVSGRWVDVQEFKGQVKHDHEHRVEGVSDTARWIEEVVGSGTPAKDTPPVSH